MRGRPWPLQRGHFLPDTGFFCCAGRQPFKEAAINAFKHFEAANLGILRVFQANSEFGNAAALDTFYTFVRCVFKHWHRTNHNTVFVERFPSP